jgi:hypothetical protein
MRHLGLIRHRILTSEDSYKYNILLILLMCEMTARVSKWKMRSQFRKIIIKNQNNLSKLKNYIVEWCNTFNERNKNSIWEKKKKSYKEKIIRKFGEKSFNEKELEETYDMRNSLIRRITMLRLFEMMNISLNSNAQVEYLNHSSFFQFSHCDFLDFTPRLKSLHLVDMIEGNKNFVFFFYLFNNFFFNNFF